MAKEKLLTIVSSFLNSAELNLYLILDFQFTENHPTLKTENQN